jgi:hypothetical protein
VSRILYPGVSVAIALDANMVENRPYSPYRAFGPMHVTYIGLTVSLNTASFYKRFPIAGIAICNFLELL